MKRHLILRRFLNDTPECFSYCPRCSRSRSAISQPRFKTAARSSSTLHSHTAVNATKPVPKNHQTLHSALADVRRYASPFVSLSKLQLAQQGLEATSPRMRIAVLGLNVQTTARRLVRLLLVDALEEEEAWERELASIQGDQGILIKFGQPSNTDLPQPRTTIPTLYAPCSLLERNNVEILVSAINTSQNGGIRQSIPSDTILSPAVGTPTAATGRQTLISQPVHASLIVSEGLDDFLKLAELLGAIRFSSEAEKQCVSTALDLPNAQLESANSSTLVLDVAKAENGLGSIRRSIGETPTYARQWNESGMLTVSKWFNATTSVSADTDGLAEPLNRLISSILAAAAASIQLQTASQALNQMPALSLPTRTNLEAAIEEFSRNAHQELQSGLASAWSSRNWRKLAWYKLFWRVDDVNLIVTDLISSAWLPRTERAVYELSGRLAQVGISPMDISPAPLATEPSTVNETATSPSPVSTMQAQFATASDAPAEAVITNVAGTAAVAITPVPAPKPLSTTISSTRNQTISRAVNDLTFTAQQLVFRTLSITGLSAGLSGLTYVSLANSLYEAGTIVALGTAFALYRMQGGWMQATKALEESLFDEGRNVIQKVVGRMKQLVFDASEVKSDDVEVKRLAEATASVERARVELDKLVELGRPGKDA